MIIIIIFKVKATVQVLYVNLILLLRLYRYFMPIWTRLLNLSCQKTIHLF